MSNEVFNFQPDNPYGEEIDFLTVISESEAGKEQRYQKWLRPRRIFRIVLRAQNQTDNASLWRFYNRKKGSFDSFLFENQNENPVTAEVVGSGDGAKSVFYLGQSVDIGTGDCISVTGSDVLTRSVRGTGDYLSFSAYTIDPTIGQITTNVPLPSGDVLRANYEFYYRVRFKDDKLSREAFAAKLWNYGLDLQEVI